MPWFLYLPIQGSLAKGWTACDGGASRTWKASDCMEGLTGLLKELCGREGKARDIFVLVISITRRNQMHIGSTPWKNEPIMVH